MNDLTKPVKVSINDLGGGHLRTTCPVRTLTHIWAAFYHEDVSAPSTETWLTLSAVSCSPGCSTTYTSTHGANIVHWGPRPCEASSRM